MGSITRGLSNNITTGGVILPAGITNATVANITSTFFRAVHDEADVNTAFDYVTNSDLAQSTSFQNINQLNDLGSDNDQNLGGTLTLFNPSSTVYVKHFISTNNYSHPADYSIESFVAGYFNTTSAINAIQFKMASGNIDDGIIKLYGVKKS